MNMWVGRNSYQDVEAFISVCFLSITLISFQYKLFALLKSPPLEHIMLTRLDLGCVWWRLLLSSRKLWFCMCVQYCSVCLKNNWSAIIRLIPAVHPYARPVRRVPLHGCRFSQWCPGECHVTRSSSNLPDLRWSHSWTWSKFRKVGINLEHFRTDEWWMLLNTFWLSNIFLSRKYLYFFI